MIKIAKGNYLTPMTRKVRKGSKDTARCFLAVNGVRKEIHLGYWGTPEADTKYRQLVAEYCSNGNVQDGVDKDVASLAYLYEQFLADADRRVADPRLKFDRRELRHYESVIQYSMEIYATLPLKDLNATAYRTIRDHFVEVAPKVIKEGSRYIKKEWTHNYVVKLMTYFRLIIRWGVGRDLVDPVVLTKFDAVEPLVTDLKKKSPRTDIDDKYVRATLPYMSPTVRDMIIIQRTHALRPSAVCNLLVGDIDTRGEVWTVNKEDKSTWKTGDKLIIKFGPEDQKILLPRIQGRNSDEHVFSPQIARLERLQTIYRNPRRKNKWSKLSDWEIAVKNHKPYYSVECYDQAVGRAIKRARKEGVNVPDWVPYQLRHTGVTITAYLYGRDKAMLLAGHHSLAMTDHYAHEASAVKEDLAIAIEPYWVEPVPVKTETIRSVAERKKR